MGCNNSAPAEPQAEEIRNTISISKIAGERSDNDGKKIAKVLKTFDQFFDELKLMLNEEEIFDTIFKADYIQEIMNSIRESYVNHQETTKIISIMLQHMALSKNIINGRKNLKTSLQLSTFPCQLSKKWKQIKKSILSTNICPLKTLVILRSQANESRYIPSLNYFQIKTQLNVSNCLCIIKIIKQIFRYDQKALCFFSNFILKSASIIFQQSRSIKDVQVKIRQVLTQITKNNLFNTSLKGQQALFQHHKSFKSKENTFLTLDLKKIVNTQRIEALDKFILSRAKAAIKYFRNFNRILQDICYKFQSHNFQSKLRLKSRTQREQILRIKLQLLGASLQKLKIDEINPNQKDSSSLSETLDAQLQKMNKKIQHICQNYDDSIRFTPTDMISSSCKFSDLTQLNSCLQAILKEVVKKGFKVIQINNHLQVEQQRPQIVVKILIQDLITEFRLIFDYNSAEFLLFKFINRLLSCKGPNILLQLKKINHDITTNFIQQTNAIIEANLQQKVKYREILSFSEAKILLSSFIKYIPIKIDLKRQPNNALDFNLFFQFLDQYKSIVQQFSNETIKADKAQKLRRIAQYLFQSEKYDVSLMVLNLYLKQVQQNNAYLFQKIKGGSKELIGAQVQLIKNYSDALHYSAKINQNKGIYEDAIDLFKKYEFYNKLFVPNKEEQIDVRQKISNCYMKSKKYQQAYNFIQECMKINGQGQLKPKLLHDLALIQRKMKRKSDALQHLEERLKLITQKYGKHSIQSIQCLHDIGELLKQQKQFEGLKANLLESISVITINKGKYCKQFAFAVKQMASLYNKLKQYEKSIEYSKQALQVLERLGEEFPYQIMKLNSKIANNYYELQKYQQSISPYQKSIKIGYKIDSIRSSNQFKINLNGLALAYQQLKRYQQSLTFFTKAIQITQHLFGKESLQYSRMLINIGALQDARKNLAQSLSCYKQAQQILSSLNKKQTAQYATILNNIGLLLQDESLYHEALSHFKQSLSIKKKLHEGSNSELVSTLSNIASVYDDMGLYQQAIRYYKESNQILERDKNHHQNQCSQNYNNIGTLFLHLGDYHKSQQYYKKSMELERHSTIEYAISLTCMGLLNLENGKIDAAEQYLNKSKDLYHTIGKAQLLEYSELMIGFSKLYITRRMFKQARQYVSKARQIVLKQKRQNHINMITIYFYQGVIHFRQRQYQMSIRALQQGLNICENKQLPYKQYSEINFYIGLIQFQMKDYKKAQRYFQKTLILQQKYHSKSIMVTLVKLITCSLLHQNQTKLAFYKQLYKQYLLLTNNQIPQ